MRDFTLYDLYVRNASMLSDETAIVFGDERISFKELLLQSERLAGGLACQGVRKGDRLAVLTMNRPEFFVLLGAIARLGAIMVPLNWRQANEELAYILSDCGASKLFVDKVSLDRAQEVVGRAGIEVIVIGDAHWPSFQADLEPSVPFPLASFPLYIIYTAAVQGKPRGAVLSHANLISANLQVIVSMGLNRSDVNLNMLPLFHITGLNLALSVMHVGGRNVVIEKFTEQETLQYTVRDKVTIWGSFPPILQRMVTAIKESGADISSLKYIVGLDGPDNVRDFEQLSDAKFWILYGQSETSGFVTFSPASERPGTAGRPGPLSTFILVDEKDVEVPRGQTGEIAVRGPLVFQGYWRQDAVNHQTFRNGWHHTGDLAMLDEAGYLVYKGRKPEKELIKPGGENVYPVEVEAVILEHPAVAAVSVIGVPDREFGEGVKAVCVLKPGATLDRKGLIEFVGTRIARYKKPRYVEFVAELPMSDGGIDRLKVKELYGG